MAEVILTAENFDQQVMQSDKPVFVDFWAPWCGPCLNMAPIVEELAGEITGAVIAKLNVDEAQDIAQRFSILSIPTYIVFKGGQIIDQFSGQMSKEALKAKIEANL